MPETVICRRLVIHGLVQGVGYRWAMVCEAERIGGLSGWVRNRRNGTVEAVVAGASDQVEALITWAQQGPPAARVSRVEVLEDQEGTRMQHGFEQRPTA